MASVCGGSLAMMDAGVPLKAPVAGMAMGLVMDEETGKYAVLSDIAGAEDHYGDMDFKVAGTRKGITALQMDIKVAGITAEIMRKALEQARAGPAAHPRQDGRRRSPSRARTSRRYAPRIVTIKIPVDKIRDVIGPGGKMIRSIIERTGVKIDVEDDGTVNVASADEASAAKAHRHHPGADRDAGARTRPTWARSSASPTSARSSRSCPASTACCTSPRSRNHRVKDVRDELKEGEQVMVKVINIDPSGKIRLSRKALLAPEAGAVAGAPAGATAGDAGGERRGVRVRRVVRTSLLVAALSRAATGRPLGVLAATRGAGRAAAPARGRQLLVAGLSRPATLIVVAIALVATATPAGSLAADQRAVSTAARAGSAQDDRRREVALRVTDAGFEPARIDARLNDIVTITLTAGDTPHGLSLDEYRVAKRVEPGKPLRFEFRADTTGTFRFYCSLTGSDGRPHDEHGELVVRR